MLVSDAARLPVFFPHSWMWILVFFSPPITPAIPPSSELATAAQTSCRRSALSSIRIRSRSFGHCFPPRGDVGVRDGEVGFRREEFQVVQRFTRDKGHLGVRCEHGGPRKHAIIHGAHFSPIGGFCRFRAVATRAPE